MTFGTALISAPSPAPAMVPAAPRDRVFEAVREVLEFSAWAHELEAFPDVASVVEQFDVSTTVARRWLEALAAVYRVDLRGRPLSGVTHER